MARVVILGAGVVGLGTALLLADDGHDVVVLERDGMDPAATPDTAWNDWERRGVNQFRLPHLFLPGYRSIVDDELPELVGALEAAGALKANFVAQIPESIRGPLRPEDADLELLTGRRPMVESVVGSVARDAKRLEIRRGVTVEALLTGTAALPGVLHVTGVRTTDGDVRADLVVDMMGRRSPLPRLLEAAGATPPHEELEDSGFMYFGRHFRSDDGSTPAMFGPALQDLGSISALTLPADNGTWGLVLVTSSKDRALLGLRDAECWERVFRSLPLVAHWLDGTPIDDGVTTMTKLEDRIRTFVLGGSPVATGVVSVGDAWACSNPSHGRGASIGMLHGRLLRDQLRGDGLDDPVTFATSFHEATEREVLPWFTWTRSQDRHRLAEIEATIRGEAYEPGDERYELERALGDATIKDPDLLRLNFRAVFVLERLDEGLADPSVTGRISELGGGWRDEPIPAPTREELIELVAAS